MESVTQPTKKLFHSFRFAFEGMYSAIKTETNWKIGLIEAFLVILAGFYFQISRVDWMIVIILIGLVLSAELGNSAVEAIVDSFTEEVHPKAKLAKDFSAGSVVIVIIASAIVGLIIFLPYLKAMFV
ncbi:MAG: Prokaryotic diacylglycerol kinase [Candidatus Daviesbacteria bacterium GW2011_GWA1_41_61]|uniref:Prokaryotic diacylglycerol kinase n=1 Tax=Candidatus Daviesbacteria bacterium GW2011_GWA2_40_9 TaxID=1618424 RepID=A0A0G0U2A8_9BACT|nr:MAG: Prokaryotic diacylglycerol kinase [Candidatus Daviesbacteria bacterium GW2011_GWC1_40_9]KKR83224.1 MAG: Prokaryotic diacylglycerol kinase [Candidatus Daviesbacteria bacterium GW2011_GWA2_40_9]KKR93569.1 MAG: Prokaryotic diacylglycerol kinase [Candidatus Daviesbacteria bacterium GW2011_GWB1_41_15]KKS14880.1 MAG: Prokaryotic diacylglycerol kinase [Candidatus Daviesbacteria bacterium GW2011_GWA1_41_61]